MVLCKDVCVKITEDALWSYRWTSLLRVAWLVVGGNYKEYWHLIFVSSNDEYLDRIYESTKSIMFLFIVKIIQTLLNQHVFISI